MLLERSPNHIIHHLLPGTIFPKPAPDPALVEEAFRNLPLAGGFRGVAGVGDYDRQKSSAGSVVIALDNHIVAKVPLGKLEGDVMTRARAMHDSIDRFGSVSPDTMVIITKADGEEPKPIVVQKEAKGSQLCDTPIADLLELKTLLDMRDIVFEMKAWYKEKRSYDLCGQKTSTSFWGRILPYIPVISDNVMIFDRSGRAVLVDNVLDVKARKGSVWRDYKDFVRRNFFQNIPIVFLGFLVSARRVYDFSRKKGLL